MTKGEETHGLSLGVTQGGVLPTPEAWGDAVSSLGRRVRAARNGVDSPLNVNVVFGIPGEVWSPELKGINVGRYSRVKQLLLVTVTLPETPPPADVDNLLIDSLEAAIGIAEAVAYRRKLTDRPLTELRCLVAGLR